MIQTYQWIIEVQWENPYALSRESLQMRTHFNKDNTGPVFTQVSMTFLVYLKLII